MRLLRLQVEHFGCVRSASLDLGPGLNVLYGPNDLGKSSLAAAIRAVLLMQHSSRSHEPYVEWQSDEAPRVELTFATEPRRIWRVSKSFGTGAKGASLFESSRDGETFTTEAKGRQVDGMLRDLLQWGIPGPGGRGAPKGEPESFLTTVLLAQQDQVTAIFESRIDQDADESGKERLTQAVQALVQDPLFRTVLQRAQDKVDEAFTAKGGKKAGRNAPFPRIREQIREAETRVAELREQVAKSEAVRARLIALHDERLVKHAELEEAKAELREHERRWTGEIARREVGKRLAAAREELTRIDGILGAVTEAESKQAELESALGEHDARLAAAREALARAEAESKAAEAELRRLESEEGEARRMIRRQALEKRQLELAAAEDEARRVAERARAAGEGVAEVARLEAELARLEAELAAEHRKLTDHERAASEARTESERWHRLALWLRYQEVTEELREAEETASRVASWRAEASEKRSQAEAIRVEIEAMHLPSTEEIRALRKLREELRIVEARLEVGLSVAVRPHRPLDLQFSRDGEEMQSESLSSLQVTLEAQRQIKLILDQLAEIRVTGGTQEVREEKELLRSRWQRQAEPVLAATGMATVEELESSWQAADQRRLKASELTQEANGLEVRADALGDVEAVVEERGHRLAKCREALGEYDHEALAAEAQEIGVGDVGELERLRSEAADRQARAKDDQQQSQIALAAQETRLGAVKKDLESTSSRRDEALRHLEQDWEEALAGAELTLESQGAEKESVVRQLATLQEEETSALTEARSRLETADAAVVEARSRQEREQQERETIQQSLDRNRGELGVRREQAGRVDHEAAHRAVETLTAELESLPMAEGPIVEEDVEAARSRLEEAAAALSEIDAEIRGEEGALGQVGGEVVRDRLEREEELLAQRREHEAEMEKDYGAWRLLLETLRGAENEQAAHLGQALVGPIAERFRELTQGRYGPLALGPNLETQGIEAAGGRQAVGALSVGTREQLSTIFRLSLAQQLGTVVLLDDQLAQSDPRRMSWFRQLLRECGRDVQIVVLTCRPEDYLLPEEMPEEAGGTGFVDSTEGVVRAMDLVRIVARAG